jgi:hypothetical protein
MFVIEETNIIFNNANLLRINSWLKLRFIRPCIDYLHILIVLIFNKSRKLNNLLGIRKNYEHGKDII